MDDKKCNTCSGTGWISSGTGIKICPDCQSKDIVLSLDKPKDGNGNTHNRKRGHSKTNGKATPVIVPVNQYSSVLLDRPLSTWSIDEIQDQIGIHRKIIIQLQFELFVRGVRGSGGFDLCPVCEAPLDVGICTNSDCIYGHGHL